MSNDNETGVRTPFTMLYRGRVIAVELQHELGSVAIVGEACRFSSLRVAKRFIDAVVEHEASKQERAAESLLKQVWRALQDWSKG